MIVQILDRKSANINSDKEETSNFESRYLIENGNYVKFGIQIDTIFRNENQQQQKKQSNKNDAFYEIINNKKVNREVGEEANKVEMLDEEAKMSMWIDSKDLYCSCPKIRLRRKYLVMSKAANLLKYLKSSSTKSEDELDDEDDDNSVQVNYDEIESSGNNATVKSRVDSNRFAGLLVDRETTMIEWRPTYSRRLRRFVRYYQSGKCS